MYSQPRLLQHLRKCALFTLCPCTCPVKYFLAAFVLPHLCLMPLPLPTPPHGLIPPSTLPVSFWPFRHALLPVPLTPSCACHRPVPLTALLSVPLIALHPCAVLLSPQEYVRVRPGQSTLVFFTARNKT